MSSRVNQAGRRRVPRFLAMIAAVFGAMTVAACAPDVPNSPYPSPLAFAIQGIDVSKYQGDVDWQAVAGSGVQFAWIKATEGGDYLDEKFRQNWELSRTAGIRRGAYHFVYWCRPAREQAAWFLANVPNDPAALPPVLDVEWNPTSRTCPGKISREAALADMKVILEAMERAYGKRPVIYTSVDFHRDVLQGEFMDYPMWVRSVKAYPAVRYGDRRWHFWQHTATGQVPGVHGYVDRNCYYGSLSDWQSWLEQQVQG